MNIDNLIFSEIDIKESNLNKKKEPFTCYTLDILSEADNISNSENSDISLNLDNYDLGLDSTTNYNSNYNSNYNNIINLSEENINKNIEQNIEQNIAQITIDSFNTTDFFKNFMCTSYSSKNKSKKIKKDKLESSNNKSNLINKKKQNKETQTPIDSSLSLDESSLKNDIEPNIQNNKIILTSLEDITDEQLDYLNKLSELKQISPKNVIVNKLSTDTNNNNIKQDTYDSKCSKDDNDNDITLNNINLDEEINVEKKTEITQNKTPIDNSIKLKEDNFNKCSEKSKNDVNSCITMGIFKDIINPQIENKKLDNYCLEKNNQILNTSEKQKLWKDILTNSESSYNYLLCESSNIKTNLYDTLFKDFYNHSKKLNKNICGYIINKQIKKLDENNTYNEEVYTLIDFNNDTEPPVNYINNIFNKDLNILNKIYLLCNNGYWILEPLNNIKNVDKDTKYIIYIYFIILRILYLNKYYPFDNGNLIQKYKNLVKTINFKLILYIKDDFKNYINIQLCKNYNIQENIDDIIKIIKQHKLNKTINNILKLNYNYYE